MINFKVMCLTDSSFLPIPCPITDVVKRGIIENYRCSRAQEAAETRISDNNKIPLVNSINNTFLRFLIVNRYLLSIVYFFYSSISTLWQQPNIINHDCQIFFWAKTMILVHAMSCLSFWEWRWRKPPLRQHRLWPPGRKLHSFPNYR